MHGEVQYLHHVGLVVRDMSHALLVYERLGFAVEPPAYPLLPDERGDPKPFGAANTVARFRRNFIEIVAIANKDSEIPSDATLVPIQVPPEHLPQIKPVIERIVEELGVRLSRFEGAHRLVFCADDVDAAAARLTAAGVTHTGVTTTQRPVDTDEGVQTEVMRHLEITTAGGAEGSEAVVAIAEPASFGKRKPVAHPNGAVDLVDAVLCVDPDDVGVTLDRYATYLGGEPVRSGAGHAFELVHARLTVLPATALDGVLPGEVAPAVPALAAYAVDVEDVLEAQRWLESRAVPVSKTASDELFVPSRHALGAAVVFRQAG